MSVDVAVPPSATIPAKNREKPPVRRPRRGSTDHLREAVMALGQWHGQMLTHSQRAWASITFSGTRHSLALLFCGEDAVNAGEIFVATLDEHEFRIPGQLVADAAITEVEHRLVPTPRMVVQCEILLLEEG